MNRQNTVTREQQRKTRPGRRKAVAAVSEYDPEADVQEDQDGEERWLTATLGKKEQYRVRRQMKARLELERRMEEKRLKRLVDDWCFDENF